ETPHDHRRLADLAFGDPADLVLEEPGRQLQGAAQIAVFDLGELGVRRGRCAHASYPTATLVVAIIRCGPGMAPPGGRRPPERALRPATRTRARSRRAPPAGARRRTARPRARRWLRAPWRR